MTQNRYIIDWSKKKHWRALEFAPVLLPATRLVGWENKTFGFFLTTKQDCTVRTVPVPYRTRFKTCRHSARCRQTLPSEETKFKFGYRAGTIIRYHTPNKKILILNFLYIYAHNWKIVCPISVFPVILFFENKIKNDS